MDELNKKIDTMLRLLNKVDAQINLVIADHKSAIDHLERLRANLRDDPEYVFKQLGEAIYQTRGQAGLNLVVSLWYEYLKQIEVRKL